MDGDGGDEAHVCKTIGYIDDISDDGDKAWNAIDGGNRGSAIRTMPMANGSLMASLVAVVR